MVTHRQDPRRARLAGLLVIELERCHFLELDALVDATHNEASAYRAEGRHDVARVLYAVAELMGNEWTSRTRDVREQVDELTLETDVAALAREMDRTPPPW